MNCSLVLPILLGLACAPAGGFSSAPSMNQLPASDARLRYEGRVDHADPANPVLIWAGDRVSVDIDGPTVSLVFGAATGQNFFDVSIDGLTTVAAVPPGDEYRFTWPRPLRSGRHHLVLFKRSEADAGHVVFRGLELAPCGRAWAPPPPPYRLRLLFLGDSITVGANNEDGVADQWDDRRTHNHARSYGYLTSLALRADHRAIAVSGMGICEGFVPMTAGETWDKVYPRDDPRRADLGDWAPDIVCINLGENDSAFSRVNGHPFPSGFTRGYVALVRAVRAAYPAAQVVLLRGGMWGGKNDPDLRQAWEAAVGEIESADPHASHFVFTHWSGPHPRVRDHQAMARELIDWLKRQPFMARHLTR